MRFIKILFVSLLINNFAHAEKIDRLGFYNLQEILEDDNLTYKILKGCVSMNSAVTEVIRKDYPDLANEFFQTANYLYPFGILVLKKIRNIDKVEAEKIYFIDIKNLTSDYINFINKNGKENKSFFKGTFLGDDLNFCNEIRAAIENSINTSKNN